MALCTPNPAKLPMSMDIIGEIVGKMERGLGGGEETRFLDRPPSLSHLVVSR